MMMMNLLDNGNDDDSKQGTRSSGYILLFVTTLECLIEVGGLRSRNIQ